MGTEMDDRIGGAGKAEGPRNWNNSLPSTSSARFLGTAIAWKDTAYPKKAVTKGTVTFGEFVMSRAVE